MACLQKNSLLTDSELTKEVCQSVLFFFFMMLLRDYLRGCRGLILLRLKESPTV